MHPYLDDKALIVEAASYQSPSILSSPQQENADFPAPLKTGVSTRGELILLGAAPRRVLGVTGGLVGRCLKIQLASTLLLFLPLYKLSCIIYPATVGKPKAGEYMLRIVRQKASRSLGHG